MTTQLLTTCPDCGDSYEADELTTVIHNEEQTHVCQACIDVDYRLCEGCRRYIYRNNFDGCADPCGECYTETPEYRAERMQALRNEAMERRFDEWRLEGGRFK